MNDQKLIQVEFPRQKCSCTINVFELKPGRYKVMENPIFVRGLRYGDVIDVEKNEAGEFVFTRIVEKSRWKKVCYLFSQRTNEAPFMRLFLRSLFDRGAYWQVDMGGVLSIAYPPGFDIDIPQGIKNALWADATLGRKIFWNRISHRIKNFIRRVLRLRKLF